MFGSWRVGQVAARVAAGIRRQPPPGKIASPSNWPVAGHSFPDLLDSGHAIHRGTTQLPRKVRSAGERPAGLPVGLVSHRGHGSEL